MTYLDTEIKIKNKGVKGMAGKYNNIRITFHEGGKGPNATYAISNSTYVNFRDWALMRATGKYLKEVAPTNSYANRIFLATGLKYNVAPNNNTKIIIWLRLSKNPHFIIIKCLSSRCYLKIIFYFGISYLDSPLIIIKSLIILKSIHNHTLSIPY